MSQLLFIILRIFSDTGETSNMLQLNFSTSSNYSYKFIASPVVYLTILTQHHISGKGYLSFKREMPETKLFSCKISYTASLYWIQNNSYWVTQYQF
jgi:hypothetical protein